MDESIEINEKFKNDGLIRLSSRLDCGMIDDVQKLIWSKIKSKFQVDISDARTWPNIANYPTVDSRSLRLNGMNSVMDDLKESGA